MAWVIDTCLVIDIAGADPLFATASARLLAQRISDGLVLCPISYVELAPLWNGDATAQDEALRRMGIDFAQPWTSQDTQHAYSGWQRQVIAKRAGHSAKRPIADILIGAFAMRFQGLLTRNAGDFSLVFPSLKLGMP